MDINIDYNQDLFRFEEYEEEKWRLDDIILILSDIDSRIKHPLSYDFYFKKYLTPQNELMELYRSELRIIQNKLLDFGKDFEVPIRVTTKILRAFFDIIKSQDEADEYNKKHMQWQKLFIIIYCCINGDSIIDDIFKIDVEDFFKIETIKVLNLGDEGNMEYDNIIDIYAHINEKGNIAFYNSINIHDHIKFPKVIELIDCIRTILYWYQTFCNYHNQVYEQDVKIDNKKGLIKCRIKIKPENRTKLFNLLVAGGFISKSSEDCFMWSFGGDKKPELWKPIKWLKENNLAVYLIDGLFYNPGRTIQRPYLHIGGNIFGINNMRQIKNGYKNNYIGKPINSAQIDEIIKKMKEKK